MNLEDESSISEINILPDGRVCLFGASQQVLEILGSIPLGDPSLKSRIERLYTTDVQQSVEPNEVSSAKVDRTIENQASQ
jgi:hypothetical protein